MTKIILEDGKYEFYEKEPGILACKRYGEEWREFLGDKAIYALFQYAVEKTYCECGMELSRGYCRICDNDE